MKNQCSKWKSWIESPVGQEALKSVDREVSMFMAFRIGVIMAEGEMMGTEKKESDPTDIAREERNIKLFGEERRGKQNG